MSKFFDISFHHYFDWINLARTGVSEAKKLVSRSPRAAGLHHQFKHPSKPGLVTVRHPDGDIPAPTLYSIQRQAGWRK